MCFFKSRKMMVTLLIKKLPYDRLRSKKLCALLLLSQPIDHFPTIDKTKTKIFC